MDKKKKRYSFEDFAPDFMKVKSFRRDLKFTVSRYPIRNYDPSEPAEWIDSYVREENINEILYNDELYGVSLQMDKDNLINFLVHYYDAALEYYRYYEYEYTGFGGHSMYFECFRLSALYLCAKYFESVKDKEKADICYLFMLVRLSYIDYGDSDKKDYWYDRGTEDIYPCLESHFRSLKKYLNSPDWWRTNPNITWNIGKYYLKKENYKKAREYFSVGANLDYDDRQSIEPFIAVARNQYELGLLYLKGLGVKMDVKAAMDYFEMARENIGEPSLPIIGDIYYKGLLNHGKPQLLRALYSYGDLNVNNIDQDIYFKNLNRFQKKRLYDLLQRWDKDTTYDFNQIAFLIQAYRYRLKDKEMADHFEMYQKYQIEQIPVEERTEDMDEFYAKQWAKEFRIYEKAPKENTGAVPSDPKIGDTFFFGRFNGEPIEWKVLEHNEDHSFYVISTKVLFKMSYDDVHDFLNDVFMNRVFTEEEKKHIQYHNYPDLRREDRTYLYTCSRKQIVKAEGTHPDDPIQETDLAKSMSKEHEIYCMEGEHISPTGELPSYKWIASYQVMGIRPSMDLFTQALPDDYTHEELYSHIEETADDSAEDITDEVNASSADADTEDAIPGIDVNSLYD